MNGYEYHHDIKEAVITESTIIVIFFVIVVKVSGKKTEKKVIENKSLHYIDYVPSTQNPAFRWTR